MKITPEQIKDLGLTKSKETYIEIHVEADVNDGNYINSTNRIDSIKDYVKISEIADKIESCSGHNWQDRHDYLTAKECDIFDDYIPYMDNEEVHTIESISFTFVIDGILYE